MIEKSKVIFALDFSSYEDARYYIDLLTPIITFYKVGLELFLSTKERIIDYLKDKGLGVFLDLKLYDIPNTIKKAIRIISRMEVDFTTIHSDRDVMLSAMEGKEGNITKILAVSLLTSKGDSISDIYSFMKEKIISIKECNVDGIVLSGLDLKIVREFAPSLIKVVPGIRKEINSYDQKRVVSPRYAIKNDANYIVVGREITQSSNPLNKAKEILKDIEEI